ncbi:uncharacterized protein PgNI_12288 [Pyricularia grisea]|uniref:Secreted protein n=1 Tax=Pyricularia grisea TaxID=148305 RepID=A0A6P8AN13_PYRGI|nr:uncharacterized protein PgNI_12288 [Pyricularia grisea]TLD03432.1 hypothetical protein PgNI_12288 [Pyricularia grisea]
MQFYLFCLWLTVVEGVRHLEACNARPPSTAPCFSCSLSIAAQGNGSFSMSSTPLPTSAKTIKYCTTVYMRSLPVVTKHILIQPHTTLETIDGTSHTVVPFATSSGPC